MKIYKKRNFGQRIFAPLLPLFQKFKTNNYMKLLLTSSGITNDSIANALFSLTKKKPEETTLVFIPTAATIIPGNKDWFITDIINLNKLNFKSIEITDISAVDKDVWLPSIEGADVLFFEGGSTSHLMKWLNKTGLADMLPVLLKDKVYVGLSAGSMVTNKDNAQKLALWKYEEGSREALDCKCLNFVDFYILPHLNTPHFEFRKEKFIKKMTKDIKEKIYVLDDNSALKIVDNNIEVISEGEWFEIN